jgi:hypothetical protein
MGGSATPIEEDTRSTSDEEGGDPMTEGNQKPFMLKEINPIVPSLGIKGFANVMLENEVMGFVFPQSCCHIFDVEEVVTDASSLNEGTLGI